MLIDSFHKNLPDYYDTMYLDGYTPEQIMEAKHWSMAKEYRRRQEEAATDREIQAQIERELEKVVSKALDDLFKGWK